MKKNSDLPPLVVEINECLASMRRWLSADREIEPGSPTDLLTRAAKEIARLDAEVKSLTRAALPAADRLPLPIPDDF